MEKLVKSLLAADLEMPMSDCVLRQCGVDPKIAYEGPGLITQDSDKAISLRVFAPPVDTREAFDREFKRDLTPGKLVPDSQYYDFEGRDSYGTVWRAFRLSINTSFGSGTYIRARPWILEKTEERQKPAEQPGVVSFLPGKIELPWHAVTSHGERGWSVDKFERQSGQFEWRIVKTDDGVWLTFKCGHTPVEPCYEAFLQGLSILTGRWLKPIYLSIHEGNKQTTRVLNRLHEAETEKLLAPIRMQMDFAGDAHLFMEQFMEKVIDKKKDAEGPCDFVHRYWHRILRARENDIENSSLVLSVAVEGLVKKTLLSKKDVDIQFVEQAEEAERILESLTPGSSVLDALKSSLGRAKSLLSENDIDLELVKQVEEAEGMLENLTLGSRALNSVKSSLGNAKHARVQDTLRRLVTEGVINKAHIKAWGELRHAAAHGCTLEGDDMALQEHLDRFHVCLDLFYRLVFHLIGYEGRHTDYGTDEWPTRSLRSDKDTTTKVIEVPTTPTPDSY